MTREQSEPVRRRRSSASGEFHDELDELHARLESDHDRRTFFERVGRQPGAALVLAVNVVPALLALWLDWDPFAIVLIYWFENGIIGLVNLFKIALARPRLRTQLDMLISIHQTGLFDLPHIDRPFLSKLQHRPVDRIPAAKPFALAAFLLTFPVFMALHAIVLFRLFEGVGPSGLLPTLRSHLSAGLGLALAALAVEHIWSFAWEFIYRGGQRRTIPLLQVAQPYPKLIVIHVALLVGALIVQLLPAAAITAVTLVLLKTALDMGLVLRIRVKPAGLREMLKAGDDGEDSPRTEQAGRSRRARRRREAGRQPGGPLRLSLPRVGLRATSRRFSGLLVTSLMFTLFGGAIFAGFGLLPIGGMITGRFDLFSSFWSFIMPVLGVPLGGLLLAAGLSTLFSAIRAGWTRAEIRVADGELQVIERGLLVWRRASCPQDDVDSVRVVKSGVSVNNVPFCFLEARRSGGHPSLEVLYGRPEAELHEVAEQLRGALELDPCDDSDQETAQAG